jgi:hypothetical protein
MPSKPSSPQSTRLENLSLDAQGAVFDLEGRPIRLQAGGYAAPVASMQEFYQHALADYYQRSAELSRQAAAARPPLLRRVLSWVGRVFERLLPAAQTAPHPFPPVPRSWSAPGPASPAPRHAADATSPNGEAALPAATPSTVAGLRAQPSASIAVAESAPMAAPSAPPRLQPPASARREGAPPLLHVVFADQDGVHVIWQMAAAARGPNSKGRDPAEAPAASPRLELTYGLDSATAQRLQACYGQLAQLGYKIAGLETVRAAPAKTASEKEAARPITAAPSLAPKPAPLEKSAGEPSRPAAAEPLPRQARPKAEASPVRPDPVKSTALEPSPPNSSFLPGI